MKKFMDENFLLSNEVSEKLYHNYSEKCQLLIIIATLIRRKY